VRIGQPGRRRATTCLGWHSGTNATGPVPEEAVAPQQWRHRRNPLAVILVVRRQKETTAMVRSVSCFLLIVATGACTRSSGNCAASAITPTIVVDVEHSQVGQPEGQEGRAYRIAPAPRLSVDARQFDFSRGLDRNTSPNAIQLILGQDRQYSATWHSSGLTELSAGTLTPMHSSARFDGFRAGDHVMLAIGQQRLEPEKRTIVLRVLWVGLIEVQ
jgi:hypothetical protein